MPDFVSIPELRVFIALTVPDGIKIEMAKAQAGLREAFSNSGLDSARWTRHEQLHLTLKFLGNVETPRIEDLVADVRGVCRGFASLRLRAEGVGCFPNRRAPRVVWAGVRDLDDRLPELHRAVADAVRAYTREAESERFAGHVTLGRLKGLKRAEAEVLARWICGRGAGFFGEWTAEKIEIMCSELSSSGARHSCLATVPLGHVA